MGVRIMKRLARPSLVRRSPALMAIAILALLVLPGLASAASVSFGTPSAKSTFGKGIVFTQPYAGGGVKTADISVELPGDIGPSVTAIQNPGSSTLSYTLDTSTGALSPFQPVVAHFQVTLADGTVQSGPDIHVTYADDRFTWKSKTGKLVTIHWFQGTDAYAQQLLKYGDDGFAKSAAFLGINESKPVDFYIYPSQAAFQAGLSVPETIGGQTQPTYRTCFALVAPNDLQYGSTVVPHELTHIVFSDITDNPYHSPPRWLNEGLAVYLSEGYGSSDRQLVSQAVSGGTLVPLPALAGYFALDSARIYLSYAESVSAVDFMVRKFGKAAIQKLVQAYGGGSTDDEAFAAAFGVDTAAFGKAWLADNGVTASQTHGPQPAPAGPVPPGWTGSTATVPPFGPESSPTSGSIAPGSPAPGNSDSSVLVLAGLIAVGGLVLLGAGAFLQARSRRAQTPPGWPPA
jgi:hypothetical protein